MSKSFVVCAIIVACAFTGRANSSVTAFYNINDPADTKQAWTSAAGSYTTITFTGYPANTIITTQYQPLGVMFLDGTDRISASSGLYPNDGFGLNGAFDESTLVFSTPIHSIAVDHPGSVQIDLYFQGSMFYSSIVFYSQGIGGFAGLVSDQPFDKAFISDPNSGLFIDDLHFGPPVPAPPAALVMLTGATLLGRSRRR